MEVDDWQDSVAPPGRRGETRRHVWSSTLIGAIGTLLMHGLIIESVHWGVTGHKRHPPETATYGRAGDSSPGSPENLALLTLLDNSSSKLNAIQNIISAPLSLSKIALKTNIIRDVPPVLDVETLALEDEHPIKSIDNGGDNAEKLRLLGIYTGQIQARIERVWRRPRTPVNGSAENQSSLTDAASFQCEAQIVQDSTGDVQEILLPRCNGSPEWQRSLVLAIQQASPLPAPPSEKVFSRSITLQFLGLAYTQGDSNGEYELPLQGLAGPTAK